MTVKEYKKIAYGEWFDYVCQCRDKTPAILPVLPIRGGGNLGGDAVGTLQ
jgi:hypothetical protein